jgi:hypothetical protein
MAITNAQQYQQLVNKRADGKRPGYRGDAAAASAAASGNMGGRSDPGSRGDPGDGPRSGQSQADRDRELAESRASIAARMAATQAAAEEAARQKALEDIRKQTIVGTNKLTPNYFDRAVNKAKTLNTNIRNKLIGGFIDRTVYDNLYNAGIYGEDETDLLGMGIPSLTGIATRALRTMNPPADVKAMDVDSIRELGLTGQIPSDMSKSQLSAMQDVRRNLENKAELESQGMTQSRFEELYPSTVMTNEDRGDGGQTYIPPVLTPYQEDVVEEVDPNSLQGLLANRIAYRFMADGGRAAYQDGSPAVDPRMARSLQENVAANEAQRASNQSFKDTIVQRIQNAQNAPSASQTLGRLYNKEGINEAEGNFLLKAFESDPQIYEKTGTGFLSDLRHKTAAAQLRDNLGGGIMGKIAANTLGGIREVPQLLTGDFKGVGEDIKANYLGAKNIPVGLTPQESYDYLIAQQQVDPGVATTTTEPSTAQLNSYVDRSTGKLMNIEDYMKKRSEGMDDSNFYLYDPSSEIILPQQGEPGGLITEGGKTYTINPGGMTASLASGGRAGFMGGGMPDDFIGGLADGNLDEMGRQMYGLGKLVKKATRAVKKIVKSPVGKAALAFGMYKFGGGLLKNDSIRNFLFAGKDPAFANLTGKGILAGIGGISALSGLMSQPEEDEEETYYRGPGLDIAAIRRDPYAARGAAYGFYAEGGDVKEPVAKDTMPLLDMNGMEKDYRADGGFVPIGRMERADDVPARLSKNEFVFTADAVKNAGDGDVDKGAEVMYNMMKNLESGGKVSEESQGLDGARDMFQTSKRLEEVL